jgi:predicted nucleic acid-binding protein
MILCCDTSFLFSLYHCDAHSAAARKYSIQHSSSLSLSPFNRFELYNAFRFSEFCGALPKNKSELYIASFERDLRTGYFIEIGCNLASILAEAHHVSSQYTREKGYRAFDIIHIATALHLGAKIFLTFDQKQRILAKSQGFETPL